MTAPFTDQGEAVVCARVALALLRRNRTQADHRDVKPLILIGIVVGEIKGLQLPTVRLALLSLSVWIEQKRLTRDWLAGVIMREYYGFSIRRCYYAEYKAGRRDDPRVTNRGVISFASPSDLAENRNNPKRDGDPL